MMIDDQRGKAVEWKENVVERAIGKSLFAELMVKARRIYDPMQTGRSDCLQSQVLGRERLKWRPILW